MGDWKDACRRNFNAIRIFDACKADFSNRIDLLDALKSIEQDWSPQLSRAIELLQKERTRKIWRCFDIVTELLDRSLSLSLSKLTSSEAEAKFARKDLETKYRDRLQSIERQSWSQLLNEFNHDKLSISASENELLLEDLFSEQTWQALGLTRKQLTLAAAGVGAGLGAGLDLALGGIAFGVFSATAAVTGAGAALIKGKSLARIKIKRVPLGGYRISLGPNRNEQFPFVLLDRFLLLHQSKSNRSHARQDREATIDEERVETGLCALWSSERRALCARAFKAIREERRESLEKLKEEFSQLLFEVLSEQDAP